MQRGPCKHLITHSRLHSFIHSTAPNIIVTLFGSSEFRFVITVLISTDHPDVFLFSIRHLLAHGKGYNQEFVWESKILVNGVWRPPPNDWIEFLSNTGKGMPLSFSSKWDGDRPKLTFTKFYFFHAQCQACLMWVKVAQWTVLRTRPLLYTHRDAFLKPNGGKLTPPQFKCNGCRFMQKLFQVDKIL